MTDPTACIIEMSTSWRFTLWNGTGAGGLKSRGVGGVQEAGKEGCKAGRPSYKNPDFFQDF